MNKFFTPGPTTVSQTILDELIHPTIGHRGEDYKNLHKNVIEKFKNIFDLEDYHIFLVTSSATGCMEGAILNCVEKNILHTICGAFSKRWSEISKLNGKKVFNVKIPWGKAIKPMHIRNILKEKKFEAITITHCETSTGVLNPINTLCKTIKEISPDTLILVDAVSAFGGAPLNIKKLGIDVMIFGVQKAFALPPGLAMTIVSKKAFEKSKKIKNKGYYFNFEEFVKYNMGNTTPTTPVIPLIRALNKRLDLIKKEGIINIYKKHKNMQLLVEEWAKLFNIKFFSEKGFRSPTVSTLKTPLDINFNEIINELKEKKITLPKGYGHLKETTFRIGHMGEHNEESLMYLLNNLTSILTRKIYEKENSYNMQIT